MRICAASGLRGAADKRCLLGCMRSVEDFSKLWNGSEPGWVVVRHTEDKQVLLVLFGASGPTVPEVKALRMVATGFSGTPVTEVFSVLRGKTEFELGELESSEARKLCKQCEELGLRVVTRGHQVVQQSLINEISKAYLLIEDAATLQAVAEEAIRRGLLIRHSTV